MGVLSVSLVFVTYGVKDAASEDAFLDLLVLGG